jgi:hypothetical protein
MEAIFIRSGINSYCPDAHFLAGSDYPKSNLSAVSD